MFEETKQNDQEFHADENSTSNQTEQETKVSPEEDSFKEKFLRISADLQNFKRRVDKERSDWMQHAQTQILESLLPIFDDLDRAIESSGKNSSEQTAAWLSGFILIQKNLKKKLNDIGIEEVNTQGAFNPELHEALIQTEDADKKSGDIVLVLSKGYSFKGKTIKPAQVSVAK